MRKRGPRGTGRSHGESLSHPPAIPSDAVERLDGAVERLIDLVRLGDLPAAHEVIRDAADAMYCAKARGKNGWAGFEPDMQHAAQDRLELETELLEALDSTDQLVLLGGAPARRGIERGPHARWPASRWTRCCNR